MTLTFDRANYSNLLAEVAPRVIETEQKHDRLLSSRRGADVRQKPYSRRKSFTQVIGNAH